MGVHVQVKKFGFTCAGKKFGYASVGKKYGCTCAGKNFWYMCVGKQIKSSHNIFYVIVISAPIFNDCVT